MVYQWYVFIILLIAFAIGTIERYSEKETLAGTIRTKYKWPPILLLLVPMIFIAGFRGDMGGYGDSSMYIDTFQRFPTLFPSIHSIIFSDSKDKGFRIITYFCRWIMGDNYVMFFLLIAAVSLILVFSVYKNYSPAFFLSAFLFIASGDYIQWGFNGIRQFLAAAIVFFSFHLLLKKKYIPYVIIVLLASTIHMSALIMIPIIFIVQGKVLNARTVIFILIVVLIVFFVDEFTDFFKDLMENTQYKDEIRVFEKSKSTNILRVMVFSVPAVISFFNVKKIRELNDPLINLCVGMSIATMGFYIVSAFTSGLFLGRLTIYFSLFNYILLPWELKYLFNEKISRRLTAIMVVLYMIFYYYQVNIALKLG